MTTQHITVKLSPDRTAVQCPCCQHVIMLRDQRSGAIECPRCGTAFVVQRAPGPSEVKDGGDLRHPTPTDKGMRRPT